VILPLPRSAEVGISGTYVACARTRLAAERARSPEKLGEKFLYPSSYSPEKHTYATFGIMDGP
jgi:hypothetical protein